MTFYEDIILYLHHYQDGTPHLHVTYLGQESIITLPDCNLLEGDLPEDKMRKVRVWVGMHKHELMTNRDAVRFPTAFNEQETLP